MFGINDTMKSRIKLSVCITVLTLVTTLSAQNLKRKAALGVRLEPLTETIKQQVEYAGDGLYVSVINPKGTLGKMGVVKGAVLQKINGQKLTSRVDLRNIMNNVCEDDELSVTYFINTKSL